MPAEGGVDDVLLEYNLPDETGPSVRCYIKTVWPNLPALMFAGVGTETLFINAVLQRVTPECDRPRK